jgi:hypothetical protein
METSQLYGKTSDASGPNYTPQERKIPTRALYEGGVGLKPDSNPNYLGSGRKATVNKSGAKTAGGQKNSLYSDDTLPNYTEEDLLLFLEELGLVEPGMDPRKYRGKRPFGNRNLGQSYGMPSFSSGIPMKQMPPQNYGLARQNNNYGGLDALLSKGAGINTAQSLRPAAQQQYAGLNVQYMGGDGTMYQFSAVGPANNKQTMVSQVLTGLYTVLMNESYGGKPGYGGGQSQGKSQGSSGSGDNYGGSGGSYGKN